MGIWWNRIANNFQPKPLEQLEQLSFPACWGIQSEYCTQHGRPRWNFASQPACKPHGDAALLPCNGHRQHIWANHGYGCWSGRMLNVWQWWIFQLLKPCNSCCITLVKTRPKNFTWHPWQIEGSHVRRNLCPGRSLLGWACRGWYQYRPMYLPWFEHSNMTWSITSPQ